MKKWMLPTSLALLISVSALADQDPAVLGDNRFEAEPKPSLVVLPDMGIATVRRTSDGNTRVLLELGYKEDSEQVNAPMQIEITAQDGRDIDITKARIAVARFLYGSNEEGFALTSDIGELDYTHKLVGNQVVTVETINAGRLVPVFSFSNENQTVIVKLKADVALGFANIKGEKTGGLERRSEVINGRGSLNYGVSAGVTLFKKLSAERYGQSTLLENDLIKTSRTGSRIKAELPDIKTEGLKFKNNSIQIFKECDKNSIGEAVTKSCYSGTAVQFGF